MKPNTMQSTVPLHSRQKAFVSASAPVLAASRRRLGLLLRQWERMAHSEHPLCSEVAHMCGFSDRKTDSSQFLAEPWKMM